MYFKGYATIFFRKKRLILKNGLLMEIQLIGNLNGNSIQKYNYLTVSKLNYILFSK
jgi:hypothetical protein